MKERKQKTLAKRLLVAMLSVMMAVTFIPTSLFAYATEPEVAPDDVQKDAQTEVVQDEPTDTVQKDEPQTEATEPAKKEAATEATKADADASQDAKSGKLSDSNGLYEVTVSYGEDAEIPDGTKLVLKAFDENDSEYKEAKEALVADKNIQSAFSQATKEEQKDLGLAAFDLTIYDEDGDVVEPKGDVKVRLKLKKLPEGVDADALAKTMQIQHLDESKSNVVVERVATVDTLEANADDDIGAIAVNEIKETAEVEFIVDSFSTYTVTWNDYGNRSATIHYGYMNGNTFVEFPTGTPAFTPSFNGNYAFLIYDVEGYKYNSTHLSSATGTTINPLLDVQGNNHRYSTSQSDDRYGWETLNRNENIYVIYEKEADLPTGGNATTINPETETWPSEVPSLFKKSSNNGNGTNKISLRIQAPEKVLESGGKADIIVVFDRSGSMGYDMNGQPRLSRAQAAVNSMADTLMTNGNIRMGLVSFSTDATISQNITADKDTFKGAVNRLSASGGTNWEKALNVANHMTVAEDRPTFVVFVTDGDPTFRISRGEVVDNDLDMFTSDAHRYYRQNNVFGEGNDDSEGLNFDFAVEEVKKIVGANKNFYAIGVSNDVTKVRTLCTDAGVASDHAYLASNASALATAFEQITAAIQTQLGYGDIKINDGITTMTSVEMKAMQEVDPNSFKYYRYGGDENKYGADYDHKTEWTAAQMQTDKCDPATYDKTTGAVQWNMGDDFQLENGVTYIVEFEAWPSQAAYDLVADLNNGLKSYASLTPLEKAQIDEVSPGKYTLRTNVPNSVGAEYTNTYETGDDVTATSVSGKANYTEEVQDLTLDDETIGAKKNWNNELDGRSAQPVTLIVKKGDEEYLNDPTKTRVSADNNWQVSNIFISCGFIKQEGSALGGGAYEVKEVGHEYSIAEPENLSHHWELTSDIYRPMVINGKTTMLIKYVPSEEQTVPTGQNGKDYFVIENNYYVVSNAEEFLITATNDRRSYLDLTKVLNKSTGAEVEGHLFEYEITIGATGDEDIWFSADKNPDPAPEAIDLEKNLVTSGNVTAEIGEDGNKTGYYYVKAGESFHISIEEIWNVRFINLPTGTRYTIKEVNIEDGFVYEEAEATATNGGTAGTVDAGNKSVTGTIDKPNCDYSVKYTNKVVGATANPSVTKSVTDKDGDEITWGDNDTYEFTLAPVTENAPMPSGSAKVTVNKNKKTEAFGNIFFTTAGTYEYTITESAGTIPGIVYDTTPHTVTVTVVEDETTHELSATVTYDSNKNSLTVVNTFEPATANLEATKVFNAWPKAADGFDFVLTAGSDTTPMPDGNKGGTKTVTVTSSTADHKALFGEIEYAKVGTYTYTIKEVVPTDANKIPGVVYDDTEYTVEVVVAPGNNGKLQATVTYKNGEETIETVEVTNELKPVKKHINVKKLLVDENGEAVEWDDGDTYTFTLAGTGNAPMPTEAGREVTVTKAEQTKSFGDIEFDTPGTYSYTVTEQAGSKDGVQYDVASKPITITVGKKEGTNDLEATVNYDANKNSVEITNIFRPAKINPEVTKSFDDWGKAESFTFTLAGVAENGKMPPMPANTTATATQNKPTAAFGDIAYDKEGTYKYTITERNDHVDGVQYDTEAHEVVVTVTKGEGNVLSASIKYDKKDTLTITNTFESAKANPEVTKVFENWGKAESFTFTLAGVAENGKMPPMPANTTAIATQSKPKAVFDDIVYDKEGTYKYTITERNDGVDGVSYDTTSYEVVVTVTKDSTTNKLSTSVQYDGGKDELKVENTFTPVKAQPKVTKEFKDWGKAESFTFKLAAVTENAPMPAAGGDEAVATEDDPLAVFGEITYDKAGTYEYTITEVNDGADGVSYDTKAHKVVVTVTKANNATNKLSASIKYDDADSLTVTNTYTPAEATLQATKAFNDWGKAESFTFTLAGVVDEDGVMPPMPQNTTAIATEDEPDAVFGKIVYEEAGVYKYTITETDDGVDGVTYDTTTHDVVVTVTKAEDATNALTADVEYDGESTLVVTNSYESAKATLQATKEFNDWGKAESFTFNLEAVGNAPMPAKGGEKAIATEDNPTAVFGEITYAKAGTYEYKITEVNDGVDGVTYDTTEHKAVVTVTKGAGNKLTTSVTYDDAESLTITNTFTPVTATPEVTKVFKDWGKADSFTFKLAAVGNAPMPAAGGETAVATKDVPKAAFGLIEYTKAGTYEYTITEQNDGADGVSYDTTKYKAVVTVTKNATTNKLSASIKYDGNKDELKVENTFTPVKVAPKVTKEFKDWGKAESFTFNLAAVGDAPMPAKGGETAVATEDKPTAVFGQIEFTKAGTYRYTITEENGHADGVTYDVDPKNVTIVVSKADDATNALTAEVKYGEEENLTVTNTYTPAEAEIKAAKDLEGRDWLENEEFEFTLTALNGAPMPAAEGFFEAIGDRLGGADDKTIKATEQNVAVSFGKIVFEKAGDYEYTIKEKAPEGGVKDGITYDTKEHKVIVKVTRDTDTNALSAEVIYEDEEATFLTIVNEYEAKGTAEFDAKKTLRGRDLKAGDFKFKLMKNSELEEEVSNKADGSVEFKKINFIKNKTKTDEGNYTFTISEVVPEDAEGGKKDGMTYDTTVTTIAVSVTDDGKGNLVVTYDGKDEAPTPEFTNTYEAKGEIILNGAKTLKYGDLKKQAFNFVILDETGKTVATATAGGVNATVTGDPNTEAGTSSEFTFSKIEYNKKYDAESETMIDDTGTHTYTIKEVIPANAVNTKTGKTYAQSTPEERAEGIFELGDYRYDASEKTVVVTVTDDNKGNLETEVSEDSDEISFINTKAYTEIVITKAMQAFVEHEKATEATLAFRVVDKATQGEKFSAVGGLTFTEDEVRNGKVKELTIQKIPTDIAVQVTEVYSSNYKPDEVTKELTLGDDGKYTAEFDNTYDDTIYNTGAINSYSKQDDGTYKYDGNNASKSPLQTFREFLSTDRPGNSHRD